MTRVPALGPRGEGWVAIQVLLVALISLAGATGPAWTGTMQSVTLTAGIALIAGGGLLALRGVLDLRSALTPFPRPVEGAPLVEAGAYRLVRHPIYGGIILGATGWSLVTAAPLALLGTAALVLLFDLKSRREEAWLIERHPGYAVYRRRTRKLIPWLY
jgi:protein-S-isoprenylcysteine O-methyltransferase Ste14